MSIDWSNLSFAYIKADHNIRCTCTNGEWGQLEVHDSEYVNMHIAATALHYGQEAFEGLKAFRGKDGKIRIFRLEENAKRLQESAKGIMMQEVSVDLFKEAVIKAVKLNEKYIPPYGTGASLYIRPLLYGSGPQIGVKPSSEYTFMVFVMPVGAYFKDGFQATNMQISRDFDRAAPLGTGRYKVGGNYAASLQAGMRAHKEGFSAVLYLDSREQKYIDECGPANFFGIKNNTYITPKSESILLSITNKSLQVIAKDLGLKVEVRKIEEKELETFEEAGACGTAAVISPIGKIIDRETGHEYVYSENKEPGVWCTKMYNRLQAIQNGDVEDTHGWNTIL